MAGPSAYRVIGEQLAKEAASFEVGDSDYIYWRAQRAETTCVRWSVGAEDEGRGRRAGRRPSTATIDESSVTLHGLQARMRPFQSGITDHGAL